MKNISIVDVLLQYRYSSTTMKVIGRYLKMHETRCEFGVERTKNAYVGASVKIQEFGSTSIDGSLNYISYCL